MNTKFPVATMVALFAAAAFGSTYYASPTGAADAACTADDPGTIQAAVNKAGKGTSWETGDEVVLLAGTYDYSDPAWSGRNCVDVPRNKDFLTIRSASGDPADTVLLGRGGETYVSEDLLTTNEPFFARAVYSASRLRLQGVTVTNFHFNGNGVAIGVSGANLLHVGNCVIAGNTGASAVALPAVITDSSFLTNSSPGDGGAIYGNNTPLYATNCLFVGNAAPNAAVARSIYGTFSGCVFSRNTATGTSGCFSCSGNGALQLVDSLFATNSAASCGVAQFRTCVITNCTFSGNTATGNCGVWSTYAGSTRAYDSRFLGNSAAGDSGAGSGLSAFRCEFIGNHAGKSAGAITIQTCEISDCVFSNNWAREGGAVVSSNNTAPVVTNCLFAYNCATNNGGAISGATHAVYDSLFVGNVATNGGGVSNYGGAFHRCRFLRNSAKNGGVAVNVPVPVFHDCEFIENSATEYGGAVAAGNIQRCLFLRNRAKSYAAFSSYNGMTVRNCVFQENVATTEYALGANGDIRNCLIISNETTSTKHGLFYVGSPVNCTLIGNKTGGKPLLPRNGTNCLFFDNKPYDLVNVANTYQNCLFGTRSNGSSLVLRDCIQTNNPHFNLGHNPKLAWYAPRKRSPARDAGVEQSWAADSLDLAGNGRLNGPIDIGCYELWPSTDGTKVLLR